MKKLGALLLAGTLMMSFVLGGCGSSAPASSDSGAKESKATEAPASGAIKVGVVNNPPSESGYREANVKDMESVFSADNGYELKTFYSLKNDEQLQAAQGFITEGVDYLLISAAETTGWDDVLKSAEEAGVKVYLFDRMIDVDESLYEDAQIGRTGALDEQFASGKMTKVVQQTATWDEAEAKKIVESVINSGEKFNVIYAENDGMAKGAVAALDEAGITHGVDGDVVVMGFDCNKWALRELLAGKWNYDGQCSPFQAQVISDLIKGNKTASEKKIINEEKGFDAKTITQEDIDTYGLGE